MLTIKHIEDDGRESTDVVLSVTYDPKTNTLVGHQAPILEWSSGRVFVMNDQGKTVGSYNLRSNRYRDEQHIAERQHEQHHIGQSEQEQQNGKETPHLR